MGTIFLVIAIIIVVVEVVIVSSRRSSSSTSLSSFSSSLVLTWVKDFSTPGGPCFVRVRCSLAGKITKRKDYITLRKPISGVHQRFS